MLDSIEFFSNEDKMDAAYADAREFFQEYKPYTLKPILTGSGVAYKFNTRFTEQALIGLDTNDLTYMSEAERSFLRLFIEWQNYLLTDPENPITAGSAQDLFISGEKAALEAFNDWLVDEIAWTPHPL